MAHYAIGDVQGCFDELIELLALINYSRDNDVLWFAGDLVNRGPQSLQVLRYIKSLPKNTVIVLGNHDLHYLALAYGTDTPNKSDTLDELLQAPDCMEISDWLRTQKLLHDDATLGYTLTHAGLPPFWTLDEAKQRAKELESTLASAQHLEFFPHMYGDEPNAWNDNLERWDKLRLICNAFTRMRYCHPDGSLELKTKKSIDEQEQHLIPWFTFENRPTQNHNILFGHWASLEGVTNTPHVFALDTGCVWGGKLTALRLEDKRRFAVT